MTTLYGSNYQKAYVNDPKEFIDRGELNGKVRAIYDEHTFVAEVNAINDTVKLGKIPKGARVLDATVICDSLGTTGIGSLGWAASSDAVEVADPNGLILVAQLDMGGQAAFGKAGLGSAGLGKKFAAECDIEFIFTEASDSALGSVMKSWVYVLLD